MNENTAEFPHVPVRVENWHEMPPAAGQPPIAGYTRSTWVIANAPLAAAGAKPVQLLNSDKRRGRAVVISLDQDMLVASTEAELIAGPSQAAPQGGQWPKLVPLELKDSDPLYALSAATGATRITVHAESTVT